MEWLEVSRTQGLTSQICHTSYQNLQNIFNHHNYPLTTYEILMKQAYKLGTNLVLEFWPKEVLVRFTPPYLGPTTS
jgi:hypothetical protein